jgi:hypothetical protein
MPNKWRLANYSFEPEVADAMRAAYRMVCAAPRRLGSQICPPSAIPHSAEHFVPVSRKDPAVRVGKNRGGCTEQERHAAAHG